MIVPYRGRFALRATRLAMAAICLAWYLLANETHSPIALGLLSAYAVFAGALLFLKRFDFAPHSFYSLAIDLLFVALAQWGLDQDWAVGLAVSFALTHAVLLHVFYRVFAAGAVVILLAAAKFTIAQSQSWMMLALAALALAVALQKRFLEGRLSHTMRHNVIIRSQAQKAAEAERERIAADFHDGPLQNFISFQMRLELIRRLMDRDLNNARSELLQLQDIARNQIADLRGFVRSMRPVDHGLGLSASLSKMAEQFERDTGIRTSFSSGEFHDPSQTEISLEVLQIVRETLNNIQRHAKASQVSVSVAKHGNKISVCTEDNGAGFPFAGRFTLEELEQMHMGPLSIKRRIKLLGGNLEVDSKPGKGSRLEIQVPVQAG